MGQAGARRICGNCGTVNAPGELFCTNCGYSLAGGPTNPILPATGGGPPPGPGFGGTAAATVGGRGARRVTGALATGDLLGGRYRIVQLVGKGGFGAVYKASDIRLIHRLVAIKEMSDAKLTPQERTQARQDFQREADLLVLLDHLNLPKVSDFFEEADKAYLVMDFIEGKTLDKEQEAAGGPLDETRVMGWALQICDVLNYLHTRPQPIIFRDLKPSNVMVTKDDEIKLIDFGIARIFKATATKDTTAFGSQGYAPLEQYGRGQSDTRSDIYALGATLYDLLTDTTPTDSPTRRVNPTMFKPPRQINPQITMAAEHIILKAMAEESRDRYQSASEMYQVIASSGVVPVTNVGVKTLVSLSGPKALPTTPTLPAVQTQPTPAPIPTPPAVPLNIGAPRVAPVPSPFPASTPPVPRPGAPPPGRQGLSRRKLLIGLGVAAGLAALGGGGYAAFSAFKKTGTTAGGASPTGQITVNLTYSSEKDAWLKAAADAFHNSNPTLGGKAIQVVLDVRGSVEGHDRILKGDITPTAWSPASFLELNQLTSDWQAAHAGQDILAGGSLLPKSLVFSPLVFAVWKERADVLLGKYGAGNIDWPALHDALLKSSWADIGGKAEWGQVKFGQTRPDQSNSGLLTITLMAYAFFNEQRGLTKTQIDTPNFLKYFQDIEGTVTAFGRSSGTFLQNVVIVDGPAAYDVITTYENLVLTLQKEANTRQHQSLQLFYPQLNILSDHPFAILKGSWVQPEQQMAAQMFRDFLLADPQQRLAVSSGFRPNSQNIQITDQSIPKNPFVGQSSDIHIAPQIQLLAQAPGGDVVNELIKQWKASYDTSQTTPGG